MTPELWMLLGCFIVSVSIIVFVIWAAVLEAREENPQDQRHLTLVEKRNGR